MAQKVSKLKWQWADHIVKESTTDGLKEFLAGIHVLQI